MNIGIIGRARAGKDTAGKFFVAGHGYRRVAFADSLKDAALKVNPWIVTGRESTPGKLYEGAGLRLERLVRVNGWENAKGHAEVRRFLQELGSAMRAIDPDIWIRPVLEAAIKANDDGVPVVVTDVRYENEVAALKRSGFHLLHIDRPGIPLLDHESERLGPEAAHYLVQNDGDVAHLGEQLERIWDEVHALESARLALKF